ncbi:2,3-diaminopropionate biosynthesis protein SbnB [Paenibacillus sp. NPDC056579]|uniref:2,3-diaminopropionate biosynthesis protein SbnB n=1 Tax=Paenibacillus sp. NPDC056579 TaxID=3345871 RepID=UPI00367F2BB8
MIYLHDGHLREIGTDWRKLVDVIETVIRIKEEGDCVHPLKPYLRFRDPINRIIAMPAYVGGSVDMAGIKWIAGFPNNYIHGLPRAHNTIILNDSATGAPLAFFQSGLLNGLRTAAVSGVMTRAYMAARPETGIRLGIIGWGPIGRLHLEMFSSLWREQLEQVILYDMKGVDRTAIPEGVRSITTVADDWRSVYRQSNVMATCTVAAERYIDEAPAPGSLLLNVSLRDYKPECAASLRAIVVDDWQEICRENTDIEQMHLRCGLNESDVITINDVVCRQALEQYDREETVFFNPMGLSVFDIGVASYYMREAERLGKGIRLETSGQV